MVIGTISPIRFGLTKDFHMKTALLSLLLAPALTLTAQSTYQGNGNTGFGGPVGEGSLQISDDGTTATFVFTKGTNADLNDALVLYVDSRPGGVSSTAGLTDADDNGRRATSGTDGLTRSTVNFPAGFGADFAIVVEAAFVGLFEIVDGGMHNFVASGNLGGGNGGATTDATFTFDFDFAELGVPAGAPNAFAFVGTYLNAGNVFRADEAIGASDAPAMGNIGTQDNPQANGGNITFSAALTYPSSTTLPVRLSRLTAVPAGRAVVVDWTTAAERDNAGFAVERSGDGSTWTELAFVAGAGDSERERAYGFRDQTPLPGESYYRLRQVDYDGGTWTSAAVAVTRRSETPEAFALALVGAHPIVGEVVLRNATAADVEATVLDLTGRRVLAFRVAVGEDYRLPAAALPAGTYLLQAGQRARRLIVH